RGTVKLPVALRRLAGRICPAEELSITCPGQPDLVVDLVEEQVSTALEPVCQMAEDRPKEHQIDVPIRRPLPRGFLAIHLLDDVSHDCAFGEAVPTSCTGALHVGQGSVCCFE